MPPSCSIMFRLPFLWSFPWDLFLCLWPLSLSLSLSLWCVSVQWDDELIILPPGYDNHGNRSIFHGNRMECSPGWNVHQDGMFQISCHWCRSLLRLEFPQKGAGLWWWCQWSVSSGRQSELLQDSIDSNKQSILLIIVSVLNNNDRNRRLVGRLVFISRVTLHSPAHKPQPNLIGPKFKIYCMGHLQYTLIVILPHHKAFLLSVWAG